MVRLSTVTLLTVFLATPAYAQICPGSDKPGVHRWAVKSSVRSGGLTATPKIH